ncbi:MAG: response regulator [Longimicrobiales bacterium]|nr:response regulator [Longimicrobiales bacterium]
MTDKTTTAAKSLAALVDAVAQALTRWPADSKAAAEVLRIAAALSEESGPAPSPGVRDVARMISLAPADRIEGLARGLLDELEAARWAAEPEGIGILLVEDDAITAAVLEASLRAPGYRVVKVTTGRDATERLRAGGIDVVLLDLILPDQDGRNLLRDIRRDPATSDVAVIILSGLVGTKVQAECIALGADEFVSKPARPADVRATVARQIGRMRGSARYGHAHVPGGPLTRAEMLHRFDELGKQAPPRARPIALLTMTTPVALIGPSASLDGDEIVRRFGETLTANLPGEYLLARWSADRFVALSPTGGMDDLRTHLERLVAVFPGATASLRDGTAVPLDLSAAAVWAEPDEGLASAVALATAILQRAEEPLSDPPPELEANPAPGSGKRIFFVEDDNITARLVVHRLSKAGFEVERFSDGIEAHAALPSLAFDLALLDVKVPGMDGFQLLASLRQGPAARAVPVVMLSAMTSEADVVRGLSLGADDYILKPFSPVELVARVKRLLQAWAPRD